MGSTDSSTGHIVLYFYRIPLTAKICIPFRACFIQSYSSWYKAHMQVKWYPTGGLKMAVRYLLIHECVYSLFTVQTGYKICLDISSQYTLYNENNTSSCYITGKPICSLHWGTTLIQSWIQFTIHPLSYLKLLFWQQQQWILWTIVHFDVCS